MSVNTPNIRMLRALGEQLKVQSAAAMATQARHAGRPGAELIALNAALLSHQGTACLLAADDLADQDAQLEASVHG